LIEGEAIGLSVTLQSQLETNTSAVAGEEGSRCHVDFHVDLARNLVAYVYRWPWGPSFAISDVKGYSGAFS
jgi:hypothetical protein